MFTGIIVDVAEVVSVKPAAYGSQISIRPAKTLDVAVSDSVAVNGVCLTVTGQASGLLLFDCVRETLRRSTLEHLRPGHRVNLEPSLKVGDKLGGHFVQGHVDARGRIASIIPSPEERTVVVRPGVEIMPLVAAKGSIALDGISLTVAETGSDWFSVKIVPYTWDKTNLVDRQPGDEINVETDVLARYVASLMQGGKEGGLTESFLRDAGY